MLSWLQGYQSVLNPYWTMRILRHYTNIVYTSICARGIKVASFYDFALVCGTVPSWVLF
jgi:hypothetical protein